MATLNELKQAKNAAIIQYQSDPSDENKAIVDKAIADYDAAVAAGEKEVPAGTGTLSEGNVFNIPDSATPGAAALTPDAATQEAVKKSKEKKK